MQRFLGSKLFSSAILILIIMVGVQISHLIPTLKDNLRKINNINHQLDISKQTAQDLAAKSAYLQSDTYLEQQARLKLNYKKPGENVVFIYKSPYTASSSAPTASMPGLLSASASHWRQWLNYLLGK